MQTRSEQSFPLRIGVVILPDLPWHEQRSRWEAAEGLGFAHAWTYDHLTWRGHRDLPWYAAMPILTAAAVATERIRLGPLVASPNFRHPLPFAKELLTLDDVSNGRVVLGVGSGGTGWDATMLGHAPWPASERAARFEEFVTRLDQLLRSQELTTEGTFYPVDEARTHPGCVQSPRLPFAIAATGPRGMKVAARHGQTWVTTGPPDDGRPLGIDDGVQVVRRQIDALTAACEAEHRDPATIDRLVLTGVPLASGLDSPEGFADAAGRYADAGVTDLVVHWPRDSEPYAGDVGRFERIFS